MLSLANRSSFRTLLDAVSLNPGLDKSDPEIQAIIYMETGKPDIRVTRRLFQEQVRSYVSGLVKLGLGAGDLIVIAHTQNLESIYAFWAALKIGAIPSMFPTLTEKLDPEIYLRSMAELARLSEVRAILTNDEFAPVLAADMPCPVAGSGQVSQSAASGNLDSFADYEARPDEIAFLQHSSGTTGLQKGVALSHRAVLNQIASYSQAIRLNGSDVIVSWLPLYHDMGLIAGFVLPLVQGIPLVLMSPFDWVQHPALLFRAIHDHQGTLCWLPNFAFNHCARRIRHQDSERLSASTMRLFVNCSEPVYHESHQMFLDRFSDNGVRSNMLSVSYAMAENTFGVTQTPANQIPIVDLINRELLEEMGQAVTVTTDHPLAVNKVSCGPAIPGTAVKVVNSEGQSLADRQVGQVVVQSDCMLNEYYKRPDLQPIQDGWLLTGDMGYLVNEELYIVGRSKDLIINAGKNIYPQDIEAIVNDVKGVHPGRAVAFGIVDEREGTELIAVVAEVKEPERLNDPTWRQELARTIRQAVVRQSMASLSYISLVGPKWLIKTSSGKIARAANRDKWLREKSS